MRVHKLNCRHRKKFVATTNSRNTLPVAPNLLDRKFTESMPNTCWVSDISYIPNATGWMYLCGILDLYDRKVVGWSMRSDMTSTLVVQAFMLAVMNRKGNCWDNAVCESFFKTLKRELEGLDGSTSRKEVRLLVFEYIEG